MRYSTIEKRQVSLHTNHDLAKSSSKIEFESYQIKS